MNVTLHHEPAIEWQAKRAGQFREGLEVLGFNVELTQSRERISNDPAILFGTTFWRGIEAAPGDWLLVDRASIGDPDYVSLGWNGHGRRGDHKVPEAFDDSRWRALDLELMPWQQGEKTVLCGQAEPYTERTGLPEWYDLCVNDGATHFRPHPSGPNPTGLPEWTSWDDVELALTLNSSVAIDALINGVVPVVFDEGGMADAWQSATRHDLDKPAREPFFEWLAWTQWGWGEIRGGQPIEHLFSWLE